MIEASLVEPPLVDLSPCSRQGDQHDALAPGPIPDEPCHLVPILPQRAGMKQNQFGPKLVPYLDRLVPVAGRADLVTE